MDITERKITKIARVVSAFAARALRAEGLGASEYELLHAVRHSPGATQAELCARLSADKGAIARQAASLEQKGYLRRESNPDDGRSRRLYATARAESLKGSRTRAESACYEVLLEALSEDEQRELARLLDAVYLRSKAERRLGCPAFAARLAAQGDADADSDTPNP